VLGGIASLEPLPEDLNAYRSVDFDLCAEYCIISEGSTQRQLLNREDASPAVIDIMSSRLDPRRSWMPTQNTLPGSQAPTRDLHQYGQLHSTTSYSGAPPETKSGGLHFPQFTSVPNSLPDSPVASSCSGEHSCCDNPACELSTTTSVKEWEACSLEACLNPDKCDREECCSDEACVHPADLDIRELSSAGGASDTVDQDRDEFAEFINHDTIDPFGSMPCQWLETDHQCSVTAPPAALSQHVFKDHIEQNAFLPCGWAQCDQTVESQQLLQHVVQAHRPDEYVCLWQGCGYSFSSDEELAAHMSAMHCTKLDCHWGGCELIHMDPVALKSHITDEHLSGYPNESFHSQPHDSSPPALSSETSMQHLSQRSSSSYIDPVLSQHDFVQRLPDQSVLPVDGRKKYHCLWQVDRSARSVCAKSFPHENDLQAHVEEVHLNHLSARAQPQGKTIFVCRWQSCKANGSPYNGKDKLRKHTYTHTGCKYPINLAVSASTADCSTGYFYQCHVCSHKFSLKGPYENHLRIHTGEKPFRCEECESTFPSKESLSTCSTLLAGGAEHS